MEQLDENLLKQVGRSPPGGSLPLLNLNERVAVNVLWRRGVSVPVLMKIFQVGKNTLYGNCLTGGAAYLSGQRGIEANAIVDEMGLDAAEAKYVTGEMKRAVNAAHRRLLERRAA